MFSFSLSSFCCQQRTTRPSNGALSAVIALWLLLVTIWMASALRYQNTPAPFVQVAMQLPPAVESTSPDSALQMRNPIHSQASTIVDAFPIANSNARATLVMAVHPACPCTRASLRELERVLTTAPARSARKLRLHELRLRELRVVILIYRPRVLPSNWREISLDVVAPALRSGPFSLRVVEDIDAEEARALGLNTSGEVGLYNQRNQLVFNGGVTASRGHEGESYGAEAIAQFLENGTVARQKTAVFGCSIFSDSDTS